MSDETIRSILSIFDNINIISLPILEAKLLNYTNEECNRRNKCLIKNYKELIERGESQNNTQAETIKKITREE